MVDHLIKSTIKVDKQQLL
jgi:hypothetical protein